MSISLTSAAADRVRSHLANRGRGVGLRLGLKTTGCSGYSYVIDYADAPAPDDLVFEDHGVQVFVDSASFPLLDGTRVDFVRKGLNESFQFANPNVKAECGCGESFSA
jgi:iron-sulfur cluster assembly protein